MDLEYLQQQADILIPKPKYGDVIYKKKHNTNDIIDLIMYADSLLDNSMCRFANLFTRDKNGLYDLWDFVHNSLYYQLDPADDERVKSPQRTWEDKIGNCKGYSLFIASVLKCLGIKYSYAFPTFYGSDKPTHVYIIAHLNNNDYVLDSTINEFNYAETYKKRILKKPMVSYLNAPDRLQIRTGKAARGINDAFNEGPKKKTGKKYIDYSGLTEGELTLQLIKQNL